MSHIFISYSRQDQDYVALLAQALESHRLPVWLDDRINYGSEWPREIQRHLDACLAVVLVMSPRSRESTWVSNELVRAIRLGKKIIPLWLEGDIWLEVESYQAFDVRQGNIPPDPFFNDLRPLFSAPAATADSITVQDVMAEDFEPFQAQLMAPFPFAAASLKPSAPTAVEDNLSSEKGIDYTYLRDLLKAQDWRAADEETYEVMIRAIGKKSAYSFTSDELLNLPCMDLRTIDHLWVKYSRDKFGFSVQKKIYEECGAKLDREYQNDEIWHEFCKRVGWRKSGTFLYYRDLAANISLSSSGEFPLSCYANFSLFIGIEGLGFGKFWPLWLVRQIAFSSLIYKLRNCN